MGLYNFLGTVLLGLSSSAPRSARLHKLIEMVSIQIIADSAKTHSNQQSSPHLSEAVLADRAIFPWGTVARGAIESISVPVAKHWRSAIIQYALDS